MTTIMHVGSMPSDDGKRILISVAIRTGDRTTVIYQGEHLANMDDSGMAQIPSASLTTLQGVLAVYSDSGLVTLECASQSHADDLARAFEIQLLKEQK